MKPLVKWESSFLPPFTPTLTSVELDLGPRIGKQIFLSVYLTWLIPPSSSALPLRDLEIELKEVERLKSDRTHPLYILFIGPLILECILEIS
jgi:hypothetical protein